jgi:hypothetical protein
MRGTLDKGRAFRTEQAKEQLHDLLMMCLANHGNADDIASRPARYLIELGIAKDPKNLLQDGWKRPFTITANTAKTDFLVDSDALDKYYAKQKRDMDKTTVSNEE